MSTYVIGDVQGCFNELEKLLEKIHYDPAHDALWFTGDLVNRGSHSLEVLRFVKKLTNAVVVLGNHDLHLLTLTLANHPPEETFVHTMDDVLLAADRAELIDWLRRQPLAHYDAQLNYFLSHAGVPPGWDIPVALSCAREVEQHLQAENVGEFFDHLFGDLPDQWDDALTGWDRSRYIVNAFTRMRLVNPEGKLILEIKGKPGDLPEDFIPWFEYDNKILPTTKIVFGHWAALEGVTTHPNAIALDTGCVWGGKLTAFCLEDQTFFSVTKE